MKNNELPFWTKEEIKEDKFLLTWSCFDEIKKLGIKPYEDRLRKYL